MAENRWTEEQLQAITARDCSLLVSAAAGAGKTAVLVERIIRRITDTRDPVDVDSLLIVTFTKAAAAEMRERIGAAITGELSRQPDSLHLKRQLILLNRASITTLHSFCLDVLRQYFYRLDLDPAFKVADETEAELLRMEVLDELFEDRYEAMEPGFLNLVDSYGGDRDDTALKAMVLKMHNFAVSNPFPEAWLTGAVSAYRAPEGEPLENSPWAVEIMKWVKLQLQGCIARLRLAAEKAAQPGGPGVYLDTLADDLKVIGVLEQCSSVSWDDLFLALNSASFGSLKACRDRNVDEKIKKRVQGIRLEVKKSVKNLQQAFFARPGRELLADLHRVAPLSQALTELTADFRNSYRKAKLAKGLVDFADLEHCCLQVLLEEGSGPGKLVPSAGAFELREQFAEVLVDEYQDINMVQETILMMVSKGDKGGSNRFMVGDLKQSIYRFRLADPSLFKNKYKSFSQNTLAPERRIDLTCNFRSRQQVVDEVNFVFRQLMTPGIDDMLPYDAKAELVCGAVYPDPPEGHREPGPAELYILEKQPADNRAPSNNAESDDTSDSPADEISEGPEPEDDLDATAREARLVAGRIKKMVAGDEACPGPEFSVMDRRTGTCRPVTYRDIVVLMRATRQAANVFMEEFRLAGIPAYADLDTGYFEATEVETMMSLLRVIDNPRQDIALAGILKSPVVGLTSQQLADIRLRNPNVDFYDAVRMAAEAGETAADRLAADFLARLEDWRTEARRVSLAQLIWRLYNETDYYAFVGGMPGGAQRQANLRALHARAGQFEATSFRGLFRFLRFIEKFQESGSDLGTAGSAGENEDVVRVISIHKSKGLEFPVVIVTGLGKQFNTVDIRQRALFHRELGLGLPVVDLDLRLSYPTMVQLAIGRRLYMEMLAEEMRILYVAMTRAREKLILAGSVRNAARAAERWCDYVDNRGWTLPDADLAAARTFLDWLGPALARHPDGGLLREHGHCAHEPAGLLTGDPSRWQLAIITGIIPPVVNEHETPDQEPLLTALRQGQPVPVPDKYSALLDSRLSWTYPHQAVADKPAKVAVTELKRRWAVIPGEESGEIEGLTAQRKTTAVRPRFIQEVSGLSPAEQGMAVHLVMQHLNLTGDLSVRGISETIAAMVDKELLIPEQAAAVDPEAVAGFLATPLGRRMTSAGEIYRELPFTMTLPFNEVFGETQTAAASDEPAQVPGANREKVLVQGVIDCLINEDDGFVIIDYKTDRIRPEQVAELTAGYRVQLDLYARAVETILRKHVKEKYLYLFHLGETVSLEG